MRASIHSRPLQRGLGLLLVLLGLVLLPKTARAESWGQYLIIIDDSTSMDQSDPDRLVMMASLALVAGLGDGDQVMIAGLNELASTKTRARFSSPRELLAGRDGAEGASELAGLRYETMAAHRGATPCREALNQARTILEEGAGAGAPQTLLLLTDGACTGGVDPAQQWLAGVSSHQKQLFRFALLSQPGRGGRIDPALVEYATATGWTTNPAVRFDARSLLRAFAEVLSFSRGLRYDEGGVGLSRSFAGAREVRVLAISTEGHTPITLGLTDASMDSRDEPLTGGPTFVQRTYGWSLRVAKTGARAMPFSAHSSDAGVDVLAIPSYGELRVEAVVGPCTQEDGNDARPALPWTRERSVRSGQPACTWARLVGDTGETIHHEHSLHFSMELCEDAACTKATAMQPDGDGTFNAQLGVLPEGRHDRWFRANGGSLAQPVIAARGIQSVAFGITSVARSDDPDVPIASLDLGVLPQALPTVLTLEYGGSFPEGSQAEVSCAVAGDAGSANPMAGELPCLFCQATPTTVNLQDPFSIQLEVRATSFCPMISESVGELPVALDLTVKGIAAAEKVGERRLPITTKLRHAKIEPQAVSVTGGQTDQTATVAFPAPVNANVAFTLEPVDSNAVDERLSVALAISEQRLGGEPGQTATVDLKLSAGDCCTAGDYAYTLTVRDQAGGPALTIPVTVTVAKPSFWVCPGKQILKWTLVALGVGFFIWLIRGFTSPAKFGDAAVLARAESHEALSKVGEGDEDWRMIQSLETTKRGFYKPATVHLGGASAALPSLRGLPDDARIEARGHGNATLVVEAEGIETFRESTGWEPVPVGELPIGSNLVLRRDDTYLMFRR